MKTIKHYLTTILLMGFIGTTWPTLAAKAQTSPFAGTWCGPFLEGRQWPFLGYVNNLIISDNGRISGSWDAGFVNATDSGRVNNDGVMTLTVTLVSRGGFDVPNSKKPYRSQLQLSGIVARDPNGNLVGIAEAQGVEPTAFVWTPCF